MILKNELSQVILPAGAQRILDSLMDLAGQIEATGQQVRIDVSTEPLQSYYTGLTFRGYVDGVSQYIVSGGRYDACYLALMVRQCLRLGWLSTSTC